MSVTLLLTIFPEVAVIEVVCVVVTALPIATPVLPILTTFVSDDFHVTALVASTEVPSLRIAVAVNA